MRKFVSILLMALATLTASAQSYPQDGYYRVQNRGNGQRYITLIDNHGDIDYAALGNSDLNASRLRPYVASATEPGVVNDPGSVFFATHKGNGAYDLAAQGTSISKIVNGIYLNLKASTGNADYPWLAYGVKSGVTVYICGSKARATGGGTIYRLGVGDEASNSTYHWAVKPITTDGDNYLGLIPDVTAGGARYKAFYASFPFKPTSGMKVYYVTRVDKTRGLVVYKELEGTVPEKTPVFVKCAGAEATNNRLDLQMSSPESLTGNHLWGVFFSNFENDGHNNFVAYDATTMRVLGTCADGSLGYVSPSNLERIPANSSYLKVSTDAPAELKLVTQEEYDAYNPVTITAKSYTRKYGEANPTFEYTASGTVNGTPVITCAATEMSPVGTYPIVITAGTVQGVVTTVNGTLTITQAPVAVTAKSYTIVETDALPNFEATYSGWKNGQNESVLTKQPTFSCNVPANKTPGTYSITVSGAEANNYSFTYTNGTLTITQAPTITIKATAKTMVYGDDVPELTYTVEGGTLNGTPVLSTTATKTSDVGEYDITVSAGSINYPHLVLQGAKLTVTKAPVTITAKSYTIAETDALPTFKAEYSGWKNGQNESVLTKQPTFSCNAPANKTPGTYTISVSGAEAKNYSFSYTNGTLTITQAPTITIKAAAKTMVYGDDVPELTYTVEGGTLNGTPVLSTTATKTSDVGEYDITVSAGSINYPHLVLQGAKLTVTQAPITVKAKSYTIVETDALPTFEAEYSGWKNGQNESVLTKQATPACDVPANKTPGTYTITVSGAEAKNYSFSYTNGTLTVTQAPTITVKAEAKEMTYGDAVPELTYTVEGGTLNGTPVLSCAATSSSDAGTYDITIAQGSINYPRLVLQGAKLTVKKAMLTVNAGTYTMKQNEQRPDFKATYSGWKNGDTESVLTKQPTLTTNAPADNAPGEYAVTASGAEAKNYDFTYVAGKLVITAADAITIVATDVTMVYGDEVPELKYTITGGTVTGTPKLTCEVSKTSDVGEYVIKVEKGTVDYVNLVLVNGKLTVTQAPVTVKAKSYTIVETEALPTFEAEYSGFKNGQNESVLTKQAVLQCEVPADKTPGEYAITVSGAEAKNYSFTYTAGKLTITQAPTITVKAEAKTMTYGDAVPELTFTVEGGTLTGTPVLTCEAKSTSDVGEYDITIAKGTINYPRLTLVNATLTINKAELTVKAENATREEGKANPEFTLTYSGWKNGDTEAVLTQKPVATTEADETSAPGEYEIVVSGGEAKNYVFKYVNGKLTVTKEDAITDLIAQGKAFDIYNVSGVKVRSNVTTLKGLPRGIYMINGKKVLVR